MNQTYYIDSLLGCDDNPGLTPSAPWRTLEKVSATVFAPGDRILFCADRTYKGQLWPKGSGTAEHPIRIGRYGEGSKPVIDGGGSHGTVEGHYVDGAAVLLFNQEYWEIEDLDVTNNNPYFKQGFTYFTPDGERNVMNPSPRNRYRYGVLIRWDNYGTGRHVHLKRLDIHDINGEMKRFVAEGILVSCSGAEGADLSVAPTKGLVPTNFDDVLIEDCVITRIDRTGISVFSQWAGERNCDVDYYGDLTKTQNFYHITVGPWKGSTGLVIRGCRISWTAGDAIIVNTTIGALIEHNYVEHACYEMRIGANAAVWPHNADGTVIQYNEVCHTHGVADGQPFDIDLGCHDTILQYNYTHDNEGGFLLIMYNTRNNVIRYNISKNDCNGLIWIHENEGTHFYNNTFYMGMEEVSPFRGPYDCQRWTFTNNIFCFRVPTQIEWKEGADYRANCYMNVNAPHDPEAVVGDPGFADPEHGDFRLTAASPCADRGEQIPDNGGLDYFGHALQTPFIGAVQC